SSVYFGRSPLHPQLFRITPALDCKIARDKFTDALRRGKERTEISAPCRVDMQPERFAERFFDNFAKSDHTIDRVHRAHFRGSRDRYYGKRRAAVAIRLADFLFKAPHIEPEHRVDIHGNKILPADAQKVGGFRQTVMP